MADILYPISSDPKLYFVKPINKVFHREALLCLQARTILDWCNKKLIFEAVKMNEDELAIAKAQDKIVRKNRRDYIKQKALRKVNNIHDGIINDVDFEDLSELERGSVLDCDFNKSHANVKKDLDGYKK